MSDARLELSAAPLVKQRHSAICRDGRIRETALAVNKKAEAEKGKEKGGFSSKTFFDFFVLVVKKSSKTWYFFEK
jgi:hypothetical protein